MRLALQPTELHRSSKIDNLLSFYQIFIPQSRHSLNKAKESICQKHVLSEHFAFSLLLNLLHKIMAHELNMSLTGYMQIKDLLVPKHLAVSQNSRKKHILKKQFLLESPADLAQQHKIKRLKPIGEIETIMKHFNAKFENNRFKPSFFAKPTERRRAINSLHNDPEYQFDKKIDYLINLPVIKTIKKQAQDYRKVMYAQRNKERAQRKARIVQDFNIYMHHELKGSANLQRKKRLNTLG